MLPAPAASKEGCEVVNQEAHAPERRARGERATSQICKQADRQISDCLDTTISEPCRDFIRSQSLCHKVPCQLGSQVDVQAGDHPSRQTGIRLPIKAAQLANVETVKRSAMQTGKRASSQVVGRISFQMARPSLRRSNALWKFLKEDGYLSILPTTTGATCLTSAQPCV